VTGELTLKPSGSTRLRTMFVNKPLIENPFDAARFAQESGESGGKVISPGEKLMAKSDCRTCHNAAVQTVGPGYKQIAERYKNTPENVELLSQKVMKGGGRRLGRGSHECPPGPSARRCQSHGELRPFTR
jgi:cytochrome c551/c552